MSITPKRLTLDLLATAREGSMPVRALIAAAAMFDIEEGSLRVALARLRRQGLVEPHGRGRYRLGKVAQPVGRHIGGWRRQAERTRAWTGNWVLAAPSTSTDRTRSRRSSRALAFLGFASFGPNLYVRPDNLVGSVTSAKDTLFELGLAEGSMVCLATDLDASSDTTMRGLWDGPELNRNYARWSKRLEASAASLEHATLETSLTETYTLGGEALREILYDPMLPKPLVDTDARDGLIANLITYDRFGRRLWSKFMRPFGVAPRSTPTLAPPPLAQVSL